MTAEHTHGVPAEVVDLLTYLFSEVVDGGGRRLERGAGDGLRAP